MGVSNHWFQFKQFTVRQEHAAMKVSTDACIFGAWTPLYENVNTVLDAGTGTGLLSLMLAQRSTTISVDAIELDENAATQAKENIIASPWQDRIHIIQDDVRSHNFSRKYDLIISNPPFFRNSLLGPDKERNTARHGLHFSYEDLLRVMTEVLAPGGYAAVLLPYQEYITWQDLLQGNGWNIFHKCYIKPRRDTPVNRVICLCAPGNGRLYREEVLQIYEDIHVYTEGFAKLMQPFYLKL